MPVSYEDKKAYIISKGWIEYPMKGWKTPPFKDPWVKVTMGAVEAYKTQQRLDDKIIARVKCSYCGSYFYSKLKEPSKTNRPLNWDKEACHYCAKAKQLSNAKRDGGLYRKTDSALTLKATLMMHPDIYKRLKDAAKATRVPASEILYAILVQSDIEGIAENLK